MSDENQDSIDSAKKAVGVVADLVKAAADSAEGKEATKNLGQTAVTLTKLINNVLLPIAAVNSAFDKARVYYNTRFASDLAEKTKAIPADHLVEPKGSIAGPALQALAFVHEEDELRNLYLQLLATSMDSRQSSLAHPAFIEIIKQFDSLDAKRFKDLFKQGDDPIPIIQIRAQSAELNGYRVLENHVLNVFRPGTDEMTEDEYLSVSIDNMIRLGLFNATYMQSLSDPRAYEWAESRPEFIKHVGKNPGTELVAGRGVLHPTNLGRKFAHAIGAYPKGSI